MINSFIKFEYAPFEISNRFCFIGNGIFWQRTYSNKYELDFVDLKPGAFEKMTTYTAGPAAIAAYYNNRPNSTQLVTCLGNFYAMY